MFDPAATLPYRGDFVNICLDDKNDEQDNQRSQCPNYGQDRVDLILTDG
jgi:hypothetical protein